MTGCPRLLLPPSRRVGFGGMCAPRLMAAGIPPRPVPAHYDPSAGPVQSRSPSGAAPLRVDAIGSLMEPTDPR